MLKTCYLPNMDKGRELLDLLKLAFDQQILFTIGKQITSDKCDVVL